MTVRAAGGGRVSIRYPSRPVWAGFSADLPTNVIRGCRAQQGRCPAQLSQPCCWHLKMFRTSCSSWAPGAHQSLLRSKDPHLFASYGFRPGPTTHLRASVAGSRQASSRLPPSIETGHIKLRENEGILFFSSKRSAVVWPTISR